MANSAAQTLAFSESGNTFESFLSFNPEMICTIGNLLVTFKNGILYTHDSTVYNNFYGVDYPSYITVVFNKDAALAKRYLSIDEVGNVLWTCPEIETSLVSFGTTPQSSDIIEEDFELIEGKYLAKFNQDENSIGGINEGDDLRGFWIKIKFQVTDAQELVTLEKLLLNYLPSPINK